MNFIYTENSYNLKLHVIFHKIFNLISTSHNQFILIFPVSLIFKLFSLLFFISLLLVLNKISFFAPGKRWYYYTLFVYFCQWGVRCKFYMKNESKSFINCNDFNFFLIEKKALGNLPKSSSYLCSWFYYQLNPCSILTFNFYFSKSWYTN